MTFASPYPDATDPIRGRASAGWVSQTPSIVSRLRALDGAGPVPFSVEFSPPRDADAEARLWRAVREFEAMRPAFVAYLNRKYA